MQNNSGACEHCEYEFPYEIWHAGFSDLSYAYCDSCGILATLDMWKFPEGTKCKVHQVIPVEAEKELKECECGGHFAHHASPRCPSCRKELSAKAASRWIESNAPGTKKGWRWQENWTGLYMICINGSRVCDIWRKGKA